MCDVVLGIDVGTSGVRIVARDDEGQMKSMATAGWQAPLQDPLGWWSAIIACFKQLDLTALRVRALALDGTSGTVLPLDASGQPVGLASMYNDVAKTEFVQRIKAVAPPETAAHGATSPLARLMGFQDQAFRILHQADWLMGCFCGRFDVSDENNALKTGYDPITRTWPDWIAATGADVKKLPRVIPVGEAVGTILPAVAASLNLPPDVVIVSGTTDGCAGFLASGATEAGDGVTSLGTTLTLKLLSATPVFAPQFGIYSHRIGTRWLAGGASNTGGGVLKQFFASDEIVRLTAMMDARVTTGLNYYPLPKVGERFPVNDAALEPRMNPRPAEDHIFLQGLFEGIADIEALGYRRLAELGATALKTIRSAGGGAGNDVWTALRLQRLGVPARQAASEHAAMGTARLAWWGIGHHA